MAASTEVVTMVPEKPITAASISMLSFVRKHTDVLTHGFDSAQSIDVSSACKIADTSPGDVASGEKQRIGVAELETS